MFFTDASHHTYGGSLEFRRGRVKQPHLYPEIGGFLSTWSISVFLSLVFVDVIMTDGSKKRNPLLGFEVQT